MSLAFSLSPAGDRKAQEGALGLLMYGDDRSPCRGPSRIAREEEITLREEGGDGSFQGVGMAMTTNPQEGRGQCQTPSQEGGAIRGPLRKGESMTLRVPFGKDDIGGDPSRRHGFPCLLEGSQARVGLPQEG